MEMIAVATIGLVVGIIIGHMICWQSYLRWYKNDPVDWLKTMKRYAEME